MTWGELLRREIESAYASADALIALVDEGTLDWKPATGQNWMTTGQLLHHLADACGAPIKGFVTGDWGMPEGFDPSEMTPEEMLPTADKLPALDSVAEARRLLAEDKKLALETLAQCDENRLVTQPAPAPWDPTEVPLGHRMLQMVAHLTSHKAQLFYYLKLQGKPVHTGHLWGVGD